MPGGGFNLCVGGVETSVAQIVPDRIVEKDRFLWNHRDLVAQVGRTDFAQVGAVPTGTTFGAAIVALAVARRKKRLLHLAGREHMHIENGGASIERRIVYASDPIEHLPGAAADALRAGAVALLHSARAARLFGSLVDAAGIDRRGIAIAGLSEAVAAAAGAGWAAIAAASLPNDDALLEIAAGLCDQSGTR